MPQGSLPKGQYTSHTDIPQARLKRYNSKSSLDGVCQQKALRSVDLLILLLNVLGDFLENLMRLEKPTSSVVKQIAPNPPVSVRTSQLAQQGRPLRSRTPPPPHSPLKHSGPSLPHQDGCWLCLSHRRLSPPLAQACQCQAEPCGSLQTRWHSRCTARAAFPRSPCSWPPFRSSALSL